MHDIKQINHNKSWYESGLDELNLHEKNILYELREKLNGELDLNLRNDINMFIRFLRARNFQIDLAEDMLRKHISWYKVNQIKTISTDFVPNEVILKYTPFINVGFDKEGAPVIYFAIGKTDFRGLLKCVKTNEVIKIIVRVFDQLLTTMEKHSLEQGKSIQQWNIIIDYEGFTFSKATHKQTIDCLLTLTRIYEANYPERLKLLYVINAPIFFAMFLSLFKPFVSEKTMDKVRIYGKDGWKSVLLKQIDSSVLPKFLGGEKDSVDFSKEILIPEECYVVKTESISTQLEAMQLNISRRSKCYIETIVEKVDTILEWVFESINGDIGFGLHYKQNSDSAEIKELIPIHKVDAQVVSENRMYECDKPGIYVITFENDSWIHCKEIYYKVSIHATSTQLKEKLLQLQNSFFILC